MSLPGVGGTAGALTDGAVIEEAMNSAAMKRITKTVTVSAARSIPRRGFGCGLFRTQVCSWNL
jgi:hypothetical protein